MTNQCQELRQPLATPAYGLGDFVRAVARVPAALVGLLLVWQARAAERAQLAALDDRMLRDIGLSRSDVEREASIPFWRAR